MYLANNLRQQVDKQIEALAQAVAGTANDNVKEYHTHVTLGYAIEKLATRVAAIKYGKPQLVQLQGIHGTLSDCANEFHRQVVVPALDRAKSAQGGVFGELG